MSLLNISDMATVSEAALSARPSCAPLAADRAVWKQGEPHAPPVSPCAPPGTTTRASSPAPCLVRAEDTECHELLFGSAIGIYNPYLSRSFNDKAR